LHLHLLLPPPDLLKPMAKTPLVVQPPPPDL
jgi:hypothetical protein